jgi:hypothetical protein
MTGITADATPLTNVTPSTMNIYDLGPHAGIGIFKGRGIREYHVVATAETISPGKRRRAVMAETGPHGPNILREDVIRAQFTPTICPDGAAPVPESLQSYTATGNLAMSHIGSPVIKPLNLA